MWTPCSIRMPPPVPEASHARGLVDTSVVIDLDRIDPTSLPGEIALSAVTLAELAAGPHATSDPEERARRQDRLQRVEATFDPLPVDETVARAYGRVYAAVASAGRKARGRRALDLLIAATALASDLPLYTQNPGDFGDLGGLLEIVSVTPTEVYGLGLTTIALPPPRRIGSAAASKAVAAQELDPRGGPDLGIRAEHMSSRSQRSGLCSCEEGRLRLRRRRRLLLRPPGQGPAPGAQRQPDPGDGETQFSTRPPTEDEKGTEDRGELLASQGLNTDPEEQYGTPVGERFTSYGEHDEKIVDRFLASLRRRQVRPHVPMMASRSIWVEGTG